MPEEAVFFNAGEIQLEGLFTPAPEGSNRTGAVISHPHPLYGGEKHNNVVSAVTHTLQETGHATLRFNFRGVGRSEGSHAGGTGEIEDVRAAMRFVQEKTGGDEAPVMLAGYSFGAWVSANTLEGDSFASHVLLVAPPTGMFDFAMLTKDKQERARHIIVGDRDQFCDHDALQQVFDKLPEPKTMRVIPGADHFLFGKERALAEAVREALADHT